MDQVQGVTATFDLGPTTYTLTVTRNGSGTGTVTSNPAGINCGSVCAHDYDDGTVVTLTATPSGFFNFFTAWSGACSGSQQTCQVTMTQARSVTATFKSIFGAVDPADGVGAAHWVSLPPEEVAGGERSGAGPAAGMMAHPPSPGRGGLWSHATVTPNPSSGYLHLAAYRSSVATLPEAMAKVQAEEVAQKKELEEILVRTQASPPGGTVTTSGYDGEGNRVIKQVDDWVTVFIGQRYVCHGTDEAVQNGGDLACAKILLANGQRIAMVQVDTGSTTYFHQDHLGSTSVAY